MALINCPECSKSISDQSTACPSCGFPTPKSTPPLLPQVDDDDNNLLTVSHRRQDSNSPSLFILFLLIIVFYAVFWLFGAFDDNTEEAIQYSQEVSQPYDEAPKAIETGLDSPVVKIPMLLSGPSEDGRYSLISHFTSNGIENIKYVRKGNAGDSFGKMEINCTNNKIRKTSSDNPDSLMSANLGDWYTPTPDWTDQDIVNFICK